MKMKTLFVLIVISFLIIGGAMYLSRLGNITNQDSTQKTTETQERKALPDVVEYKIVDIEGDLVTLQKIGKEENSGKASYTQEYLEEKGLIYTEEGEEYPVAFRDLRIGEGLKMISKDGQVEKFEFFEINDLPSQE